MRRKRLIALLGAGIIAANLIAPGSISVVQASEVETEQTEDAGQNTDAEESEEVGEEPAEEEMVTEKPEQEEDVDAIGQSESNDSTDLSVDTQAEQGVIKDSGACGATENDDVTWTVYDTDSDGKGDKLVIGGEGDMMNPAYSGAYPWKANAYEKRIKTLEIQEGVTSIGSHAFDTLTGLTGNLVLPEGLRTIGKQAFNGRSGLTGELVIPDSVIEIGEWAFRECSGFTGKLVIPDSVTTIGNYAFDGCSGFTGEVVIP